MMDILMSEVCWAHKKWNKITSDIKLFFYSSTLCTFANVILRFVVAVLMLYTVNDGKNWLCGKKTLRLFASLSFLGIACFVFTWVQRTEYDTENVFLGFKQLTKCGSITGAAVLELETGRFDEAWRSHMLTFRRRLKWSGLHSGYVFTIRHLMCSVTPMESIAKKQTEKLALNSIMLVINLCLCGNII